MSEAAGSQQSNNTSEDDELSTLTKVVMKKTELKMEKQVEAKEQIELAKCKCFTSAKSKCANVNENEVHNPHQRRLTLQFRNDLSSEILTGQVIKGKGSDSIEVALIDDLSNHVVESGPEAYADVEIILIKGDEGEGDGMIVGESKDKKVPRLIGEKVFKLNKGVGIVPKLKFRHSSTHIKHHVLKLGAKLIGTFTDTTIREAKTESFTLKDSRKAYYNKHEKPELSDCVWRLKNIQRKKPIHMRLQEQQIDSVEKFLILHFKDPDRLNHIAGMKPENWEVTVKHARMCKIDKRMSCYVDKRKKMLVVFNLVDHVLGLVSGGRFIPREKLSENDKTDAHNLAVDALENWKTLDSFEDEDSVLRYFSTLYTQDKDNTSSMIGECSYNQLSAPRALENWDDETFHPMDSDMMDDLPLTEQTIICPSPETVNWIRCANRIIDATNMVVDRPRPSKKWVMLINVLSLKRTKLRTNTVTYEKLLVYLVPDDLVVWKKRRVR